jgi:hypothetical protein
MPWPRDLSSERAADDSRKVRSRADKGTGVPVAAAPATCANSRLTAAAFAGPGRCRERVLDDALSDRRTALRGCPARCPRRLSALRAGKLARRRTPDPLPSGAGDVRVRAGCVGALRAGGGAGVAARATAPPPVVGAAGGGAGAGLLWPAVSAVTTAPVVNVAPAVGTAVVGGPHDEAPPAVGDAEVAVGRDAPATLLAVAPTVAALVDPPVHGGTTGGVAGGGGAGAGGGFVVVGVPAGGGAPTPGGMVTTGDGGAAVVDAVVVGGGAGGGVAVVVVVVVVTGTDAAELVLVAAPTPAMADAATHRLASNTQRALTVTASSRSPNPATISSVRERTRCSVVVTRAARSASRCDDVRPRPWP